MLVGVAHPAGLGGEPEQCLHHRQGHQLGVGEFRGDPDPGTPGCQVGRLFEQVIGPDVECGREGVQVVRHTMIMDTLVYASNRTPWNRSSRRPSHAQAAPARIRL